MKTLSACSKSEKISRNKVLFIVNEEEDKWDGKNFLYNRIMNEPQMLQFDTIFEHSRDSLMNTNIGTLHGYNSLSADSTIPINLKIIQLQNLNNSISPINVIESNLKRVNSLNLKVKETGITSLDTADKSTLLDVANQCPYTGGRAVYAARVLLSLFGYPDEYAACNPPSTERHAANHIENTSAIANIAKIDNLFLNLYPNPTSRSVEINYALHNTKSVQIIFYNNIGAEQKRVDLLPEHNQISLNLNLADGVYYYQVIEGKKVFLIEKLVIIK